MSLNFRAILLAVSSLLIVGCSDTVRSPDLPPAQLTGISDISCAPTTLGLGQTGQCTLTAQCQYLQPLADGNVQVVDGPCPGDFQFVSSNPGVVAIDNDGNFVGLTEGTSTITGEVGGFVSSPQIITVGPACALALEIRPENRRLIAGFNQTYQAVLISSNGGETDIAASSFFESANTAAADFVGATLQTNRDLAAAATFEVSVSNDTAGNLCSGVTLPLEDSTSVTVSPAELLAGGICIETIPPATAFELDTCRPDTGACTAGPIPLGLNPPETAALQIRARFNSGDECNISDVATLAIDPTGVADLDADAPSVTAVAQGQATLSAEFDGQTGERVVRVGESTAFGANSLAVSVRELIGGQIYSSTNAQRFGCVGASDLVEGLSAGNLRGQLAAFARARRCDVADRQMVNGQLVCTAPGADGVNTVDAFNELQRNEDFTNPMPTGADPLIDATAWRAVEGFWNGETCEAGAGNSPARVGDRFFEPRTLDTTRNLDGTDQPNGVIFADSLVRLGFACVTAEVTDPLNPSATITDGLTVLVLPITNDSLTDPSVAPESDRLCNTLLPIFDNPLLGVLQGTPLDPLGRIELIETLSTVTELVNPLLEELDALPLDLVVTTLIEGFPEFGIPGLATITEQLLNPLSDGLLDPAVTPGLCQLTSGVNTLLDLLTGGDGSGNQECAGGTGTTPGPEDLLGLLGEAGLLDLLDPSVLEDLIALLLAGGGGGDDDPLCDVPVLGPLLCSLP